MTYTNDPIPNCVPEYYREQEERRDHQYELALQRKAHYQANRQKLDAAVQSGLPILDLDGYAPCWECPKGDTDTKTDDEDDFDRVICHDPACRWYKACQTGEASR